MGLGVLPEDLDMDEKLVFVEGEEYEFICLDTIDNLSKESLILKCKVLNGEHAGKEHALFLSKKRVYPIMIRKLREFAKAFYTERELRSGEQPLSRLYLRKFAATALEARTHNDTVYQDFHKWRDLGETATSDTHQLDAAQASHQPAKTEISSAEIPF